MPKNDIHSVLNNAYKDLENTITNSAKELAQDLAQEYLKKIEIIIWEKIYERPEGTSYERTFDLLNSVKFDLSTKDGVYRLKFYFDKEEWQVSKQSSGFYSHANSWGDDEGKKVGLELLDYLNEGTSFIEGTHFLDEIEDLIQNELTQEFKSKLDIKIRQRMRSSRYK